MHFVGNDGESEPWKSFLKIYMYMWTVEGTTSDSLVYLFGCYVFYWEGGNGHSLTGEDWRILWKNLLIIYLFICSVV